MSGEEGKDPGSSALRTPYFPVFPASALCRFHGAGPALRAQMGRALQGSCVVSARAPACTESASVWERGDGCVGAIVLASLAAEASQNGFWLCADFSVAAHAAGFATFGHLIMPVMMTPAWVLACRTCAAPHD